MTHTPPRSSLLLGLGLGLLLGLTASACSGSSGEGPTEPGEEGPTLRKVRLALNWFPEPEFGGFYMAQLSGAYREAGFDVEIIPGGPGAPSLELLTAGRAEAAITAGDELLLKRSRGVHAVGVLPALQTNPAGIMVHAASGEAALSDIQGGRVAIEIGSPAQQFVWARHGWEGEVEPVPYGGSVAPFLADPALRQQAFITSEPCIARARGAEVAFLPYAEAGWNPYAALLALSDPPPDWAADFVAASRKGWEQYLADPGPANAELVKLNDQLDAELIGCITEAQRPFVTGEDGLGVMTEARWAETAGALVQLGLLPAGATADGAWRTF